MAEVRNLYPGRFCNLAHPRGPTGVTYLLIRAKAAPSCDQIVYKSYCRGRKIYPRVNAR
jgi:hypothetical protein